VKNQKILMKTIWKPKKKETKYHSKTIKKSVYYQICYNEGHLIKECKLLNKIFQICKQNDHNIGQCLNKAAFRRFPSKEIF
jgi:hypothetical protein